MVVLLQTHLPKFGWDYDLSMSFYYDPWKSKKDSQNIFFLSVYCEPEFNGEIEISKNVWVRPGNSTFRFQRKELRLAETSGWDLATVPSVFKEKNFREM